MGSSGLAASKVSERYVKPTILLGESEPGVYTGSARSIPGVNIYEALNSSGKGIRKIRRTCRSGGLTIREEHLPQLIHRLNEFKKHYDEEVFKPLKTYDLGITPSEVSNSLISELEMLRPFGFKNEQVELLISGAHIEDIRSIGEDKHAKFRIAKGGRAVDVVIFGTQAATVPGYADIVGTLNINTFDMKPQMIVSTLSYDEPFEHKMRQTQEYLRKAAVPTEAERNVFFIGREGLLRVYAILKTSAKESFFSGRGKACPVPCRNMPPGSRMKKLYLR